MTKQIEETSTTLDGLTTAELSLIAGGAPSGTQYNIYAPGNFYPGSNVNNFKQKAGYKKPKKKR